MSSGKSFLGISVEGEEHKHGSRSNSDDDDQSLGSNGLYEEEPSHVLRDSATELFGVDQNPAVILRETLMADNKLVSINGTKYMYISEDMGWVLVQSTVACRTICSLLAINAPVNFVLATKPVVEGLLSYECPPVIYGPTFSQGVVRCVFRPIRWNSNGDTTKIEFSPASPANTPYGSLVVYVH